MTDNRDTLRIILILALVAPFFGSLAGYAQSGEQPLLLEEAIERAMQNNRSLKISAAEQQVAEANYRQTLAFYLPQVSVSYTAVTTDNPLHAFGMKLQQQSVGAADFDPARLNHPDAAHDFSAQAELRQPLLNLDLMAQRQAMEAQMEMYALQYQRRREALRFEVQKAYMELQMAHHSSAFLQAARDKADTLYKTAQNFYAQGLIQKSDELNARLYLTTLESEAHRALRETESAAERLGHIMGDTVTRFSLPPLGKIADEARTMAQTVPSERTDFLAMDKALEGASWMVKSAQLSRFPRLNAFASYQLNDRKAVGFQAGSYMAGASLTWDLFTGTRNRNAITAKQHEQERAQLQVENYKTEEQVTLNAARRDLESARFRVSNQELSVQQAAESLRIIENRYAEGLVSTNDLLLAQTRWSQENLGYTGSLFAFNMAFAWLQFLTTSEIR